MKRLMISILFATLSLTMCAMKTNDTIQMLQAFLDNEVQEPTKEALEIIKKKTIEQKIALWIDSIKYLVQKNNVAKASSLIDFLFDEKSINQYNDDYGYPLRVLLRDAKTANKALYKYHATINEMIVSPVYPFYNVLSAPDVFVRVICPVQHQLIGKNLGISFGNNIFKMNTSTYNNNIASPYPETLSNQEFFLKINSLNNEDLEKEEFKQYKDQKNIIITPEEQLLYLQEVLKPNFYPETVTQEAFTAYHKKVFTLLCCLKAKKLSFKKRDIPVVNKIIIPKIDTSLFTNKAKKVFSEFETIFKKLESWNQDNEKPGRKTSFDQKQVSHMLNQLNDKTSRLNTKMNKLISFANVKKLFEYHNPKKDTN